MASLKEIKGRIHSVKSTQKITSAMKMVSSAKLRKAQKVIENFLPYEQKLNALLQNFLTAQEDDLHPSSWSEERELQRVAVVAFASNSSLCGSFNANVIRKMEQVVDSYRRQLGEEHVLLYPIGKKMQKAAVKKGFAQDARFDGMLDKPSYEASLELSLELMRMFESGQVDRVEFIYHHFHSRSSQILRHETWLPIALKTSEERLTPTNYLVEPDKQSILDSLIPKALHLKMYAALLDSVASEHAARTIAMQLATDNADELLDELSLQYNKLRQQAITSELLDIVGGSFGMNA